MKSLYYFHDFLSKITPLLPRRIKNVFLVEVNLMIILSLHSFHMRFDPVGIASVHLPHGPVEHYESNASVHSDINLQSFDIVAMHEEGVDFVKVLKKDSPFKPINNNDKDLAELQGYTQTEEYPVRALLYCFYLSNQTN